MSNYGASRKRSGPSGLERPEAANAHGGRRLTRPPSGVSRPTRHVTGTGPIESSVHQPGPTRWTCFWPLRSRTTPAAAELKTHRFCGKRSRMRLARSKSLIGSGHGPGSMLKRVVPRSPGCSNTICFALSMMMPRLEVKTDEANSARSFTTRRTPPSAADGAGSRHTSQGGPGAGKGLER